MLREREPDKGEPQRSSVGGVKTPGHSADGGPVWASIWDSPWTQSGVTWKLDSKPPSELLPTKTWNRPGSTTNSILRL